MSRITVRESIDSPEEQWAAIRWAGAAKQAFSSKRGQAALRELETALLALPQKRLIGYHLYDAGEVCALGALALYQAVNPIHFPAVLDDYDDDTDNATWANVNLGLTYTLAWEIMCENDEVAPFTPEKRYEYMLHWVRSKIQ